GLSGLGLLGVGISIHRSTPPLAYVTSVLNANDCACAGNCATFTANCASVFDASAAPATVNPSEVVLNVQRAGPLTRLTWLGAMPSGSTIRTETMPAPR